MWSSTANDFSFERPLEDLADGHEYNFTQQDSQGLSQSLSQSLSQYSVSQIDLVPSQGLSAGPVCAECQGTEFSTTDMGDMVCALCGTAYAGNVNETQEANAEKLQGIRTRRLRKEKLFNGLSKSHQAPSLFSFAKGLTLLLLAFVVPLDLLLVWSPTLSATTAGWVFLTDFASVHRSLSLRSSSRTFHGMWTHSEHQV